MIDSEECYDGVRRVAAPIWASAKIVASVSITDSIFNMTIERINNEFLLLETS